MGQRGHWEKQANSGPRAVTEVSATTEKGLGNYVTDVQKEQNLVEISWAAMQTPPLQKILGELTAPLAKPSQMKSGWAFFGVWGGKWNGI